MREIKFFSLALILNLLLNILICSSTLLLHEIGHFLLGLAVGCKEIKLVLLDSELGTYTEMNCPREQSILFPLAGAFVIVLPFLASFLIFKNFLERNLFWIGIGFNLTIALVDFPSIAFLQFLIFSLGLALILYGEILLIDKVLSFIR